MIERKARPLTVRTKTGFEVIQAYYTDVRGLAVNQMPGEEKFGWTISHVRSGLSITPSGRVFKFNDVRRLIKEIPALGIDWTADRETVAKKAAKPWGELLDELFPEVELETR